MKRIGTNLGKQNCHRWREVKITVSVHSESTPGLKKDVWYSQRCLKHSDVYERRRGKGSSPRRTRVFCRRGAEKIRGWRISEKKGESKKEKKVNCVVAGVIKIEATQWKPTLIQWKYKSYWYQKILVYLNILDTLPGVTTIKCEQNCLFTLQTGTIL